MLFDDDQVTLRCIARRFAPEKLGPKCRTRELQSRLQPRVLQQARRVRQRWHRDQGAFSTPGTGGRA